MNQSGTIEKEHHTKFYACDIPHVCFSYRTPFPTRPARGIEKD